MEWWKNISFCDEQSRLELFIRRRIINSGILWVHWDLVNVRKTVTIFIKLDVKQGAQWEIGWTKVQKVIPPDHDFRLSVQQSVPQLRKHQNEEPLATSNSFCTGQQSENFRETFGRFCLRQGQHRVDCRFWIKVQWKIKTLENKWRLKFYQKNTGRTSTRVSWFFAGISESWKYSVASIRNFYFNFDHFPWNINCTFWLIL